MKRKRITRWVKIGFFLGVGFSLAVSAFYIAISIAAGLVVPLLELYFGTEFPNWFAWSLGIITVVLLGTLYFRRHTKFAQVSGYCFLALGIVAGGFYISGIHQTSVAAPLEMVEPVDGYNLDLHRDYRTANLPRCTALPLVYPRANDLGFAEHDTFFNMVFGEFLAATLKKDSGRCRIKVTPREGISLEEHYLVFGTKSEQIIIPLEEIDGEIYSGSFIGVMDGGGIPIPGMHEVVFEQPYRQEVYFKLVKLKDS